VRRSALTTEHLCQPVAHGRAHILGFCIGLKLQQKALEARQRGKTLQHGVEVARVARVAQARMVLAGARRRRRCRCGRAGEEGEHGADAESGRHECVQSGGGAPAQRRKEEEQRQQAEQARRDAEQERSGRGAHEAAGSPRAAAAPAVRGMYDEDAEAATRDGARRSMG
jgi:hypothetical protein